jgi:hypothetical protein
MMHERRLFSARAAAQMLGVSRGRTIAFLIDTGQVRTVEVNGRKRIPMSEIDRLASVGFDTRQSPGRTRR